MASEPPVEAAPIAVYASWGQRGVAWLFDITVVWGAIGVLVTALAFATGDGLVGFFLLLLIAPFAPLYYAFFHAGERGQTLGKRAIGIAVRSEKTLGRISMWRALGRAYIVYLFLVLWTIPWIVDYLWPLWDPKHQALHDKFVASVVVRVDRPAPAALSAG